LFSAWKIEMATQDQSPTRNTAAPPPNDIAGYDYEKDHVARSPVTLDELEKLKQAVDFTEKDRRYLRMAGEVLSDQAEDMVNTWREKIGAQPHLAVAFQGPDGKPDNDYKSAVKPRFVQWVVDLCTRPFDQAWLDYQEEIALRHLPEKKNKTDNAETPPIVPLRYMLAFTAPVVLAAKEFLAKKGYSDEEVEQMQTAWTKAVLLTMTLWSRPYSKGGLW
jgi:hypothetical protein